MPVGGRVWRSEAQLSGFACAGCQPLQYCTVVLVAGARQAITVGAERVHGPHVTARSTCERGSSWRCDVVTNRRVGYGQGTVVYAPPLVLATANSGRCHGAVSVGNDQRDSDGCPSRLRRPVAFRLALWLQRDTDWPTWANQIPTIVARPATCVTSSSADGWQSCDLSRTVEVLYRR